VCFFANLFFAHRARVAARDFTIRSVAENGRVGKRALEGLNELTLVGEQRQTPG